MVRGGEARGGAHQASLCGVKSVGRLLLSLNYLPRTVLVMTSNRTFFYRGGWSVEGSFTSFWYFMVYELVWDSCHVHMRQSG